jgi:hypothetical protein
VANDSRTELGLVGCVTSRGVGTPAPSRRLTLDDVLRDSLVRELLEARLVCVFATFDRAVGIHAVPMWYALDGDTVLLATGARSRKVRNLERDHRATLVLHDSRPGFEVCGASLVGTVELVRGTEAARFVARVHDRYVDRNAQQDPDARRFLASDDVALVLTPVSAFTWDERGSAAARALARGGWAHPLAPTSPRASS